VKVTSWIAIGIGAFAFFQCGMILSNSRQLAYCILTGDWASFKNKDYTKGKESVSRAEYDINDIVKIIMAISMIFCLFLIGIGIKGLRAAKSQDGTVSKKVMRCSLISAVIMTGIFYFTVQKGLEVKVIKEAYNQSIEEKHSRNLSELFKKAEPNGCVYKDADTCDADSECAWCEA